MGFTIVTHMCIHGPMSWSVLSPNIVWITGKTSFIHEWNYFQESNYKTTTKKTFSILIKSPDGVAIIIYGNAAGWNIYFFDSNWRDKQNMQWRKLKHHWLGQADAEPQICLSLIQKNYIGKVSAEKVEQIMFKYP